MGIRRAAPADCELFGCFREEGDTLALSLAQNPARPQRDCGAVGAGVRRRGSPIKSAYDPSGQHCSTLAGSTDTAFPARLWQLLISRWPNACDLQLEMVVDGVVPTSSGTRQDNVAGDAVLGIYTGHDASIALVIDGHVVGVLELERLFEACLQRSVPS